MLEGVREAPSKCKSVLSWSRLNPKPLQLGWGFRMSRSNLSCVPALVDHAHWLSQRKGTSVTLGNLLPSKKTVPGEGNEELGILRGSRTEHPGTQLLPRLQVPRAVRHPRGRHSPGVWVSLLRPWQCTPTVCSGSSFQCTSVLGLHAWNRPFASSRGQLSPILLPCFLVFLPPQSARVPSLGSSKQLLCVTLTVLLLSLGL